MADRVWNYIILVYASFYKGGDDIHYVEMKPQLSEAELESSIKVEEKE